MPALTSRSFFPDNLDRAAFNSKRNPHGCSVKDGYPDDWVDVELPDKLYFIYIAVDTNQKLVVRQLYDRIGSRGIDAAEAALFRQARGETGQAEDKGVNFDQLVFQEPCYFTMALDHPTWQFYDSNHTDHDPFVFIPKKEKIVGTSPMTISYDPNYSFFEADVKPITGLSPSSVRCVNYFRADMTGRWVLPGEVQHYGFEIYVRVPFSLRGTGDEKVTILIDPDGQNQGPKVQ